MEIDEVAARVVRSYWALLLVMTVLPLLLTGYVMSGKEPPYAAGARIQASSRATDAAPGDAGVSIVVSQVKAFATGRSLLDRVIAEQRAGRSAKGVAERISVTGLGTSTVVELTVKDADPEVARRLTDAIGAAVVAEINRSNQGAITTQIADLDARVRELEKKLGPLSRKAGTTPPDTGAASERERVQAELADLRSDRSELRTQLSAAGVASVVQPAVLAPRTNPVVMMSVIAALAGLIGGILAAVVIEMFRPTVPGQTRVARRLGVPLLGWADRTDAELADMGRRIRLSAKREGVDRVALVGTGSGPLPAELVSGVASVVYRDASKVVTVPPPADEHEDGPEDPEDPGSDSGSATTTNNHSPSGGDKSDISIVRSTGGGGTGTAVMAKKSAEAVETRKPADAVSPTEVTQPVPPVAIRAQCHVHAFEDIDPGSDDEVGVVAVVGPVTLVSGLDSVRDLVAASGWPLLGVIATSRKIRG